MLNSFFLNISFSVRCLYVIWWRFWILFLKEAISLFEILNIFFLSSFSVKCLKILNSFYDRWYFFIWNSEYLYYEILNSFLIDAISLFEIFEYLQFHLLFHLRWLFVIWRYLNLFSDRVYHIFEDLISTFNIFFLLFLLIA